MPSLAQYGILPPMTHDKYALRLIFGCCLLCATLFAAAAGLGQVAAQGNPTPIPLETRISPTLLPPAPTPTPFAPITRSAVARIRERNPQTVIVGLPFNNKPFSSINAIGALEGFEADLARAIAEDWGVKIEYRHTTRQNALTLLFSGQIDLLMGQQILSRDALSSLDFSDPIFVGKQVALAMADAPQNSITELGGQAVGVVAGSRGEVAFAAWAAANGLAVNILRYPMLDDAMAALGARQITALIGDRWELDQRVRVGGISGVKLLEGVVSTEPYAIAMPRYDDSLRTIVNRTLQRMARDDRLNPIYDVSFPDGLLPNTERVYPIVWRDLDADTRTLQDFPADIVRPARGVLDRLRAGEPLRVVGLGTPVGADGQPTPLERLNAAIIFEMARRWNVQVGLVPGGTSPALSEDILASGGADLAVGLEPHWGTVDRLDFVGVYAERGYRMFARVGSGIQSFADLRTGIRSIGTYSDDPASLAAAKKLALSVGLPERTLRTPIYNPGSEAEIINAVFEVQSVRVFFGDALRIVPLAQANANRVELTPRLYDPRPIGFGVPRNDADFRDLIAITLQEMARDGTYERIFREQWNIGDPQRPIVWPGTAQPFGVRVN